MPFNISVPADLPDHLRPGEGAHDDFFAAAETAGLSEPQVQALIGWYYDRARTVDAEQTDALAESRLSSEAALRAQWGADYDANVDFARGAAGRLFGDGAVALLELRLADGTMLGDQPQLIEGLARIGRKLDDGGQGSDGGGGGSNAGGAPARAMARGSGTVHESFLGTRGEPARQPTQAQLQRIKSLRALQDTDPVRYRSPTIQEALRRAYEDAYDGAPR